MKKLSLIGMGLVLLMTLTQCKKAETPSANEMVGEKVHITLDVDNGSKNFVHPETGNAFFTNGDEVLVANNGRYVGTLVYNSSNRHFSGDIEGAVESDYLHFYFMGNQTLAEGTPSNSTTSFTVNISDQTNCYPQIAYAPSSVKYSGGMAYKAKLLNKCALVKFTTTNEILVGAAVTLSGLNNQVSVNLGSKEFTYSQVDGGNIKLHSESTTSHWAILLPGDAATVTASATGYKTTTGISIPSVSANDYLTDGASFTLTEQFVDLGLPSGLLWATCNVGADTPEGYGNYFAWGETQQKNTSYNWSNYLYCTGDGFSLTMYCDYSYYGYNGFTDDLTTLLPEDDAATANWGDGWRMPTKAEFEELRSYTTSLGGLTTQNGVYGLRFTASNGNSLFLPAAGYRDDNGLNDADSRCYYWSSSLYTESQPNFAWGYFYSSTQSMWGGGSIYEYKTSIENRNVGFTVRPVCSLRKN